MKWGQGLSSSAQEKQNLRRGHEVLKLSISWSQLTILCYSANLRSRQERMDCFSRLFLVPASADFLSISNKWFSPAVVQSLSTSSRQLDCVSVSFSFWLCAQTSCSTALTSTWNTWSRWIVKSTNKKTKFVVISYNSYTFCVQISTHTPLPVPQLPSHSSLEKHYNPQEGHPGRLPFQCPQDELFFELSTIVRTNTHY